MGFDSLFPRVSRAAPSVSSTGTSTSPLRREDSKRRKKDAQTFESISAPSSAEVAADVSATVPRDPSGMLAFFVFLILILI